MISRETNDRGIQVKKLTGVLVVLVLVLMISFSVSAASVTPNETVTLQEGATAGSFQVTVESDEPFSGAEFAAECEDGITISSVTYSAATSAAGPTTVNGNTYFSFFSGENAFSGRVTATVSFTCAEEKEYQITLKTAKIYTITEGSVDPAVELQTLDKVITVGFGGDSSNTSSGDSSNTSSDGSNGSSNGGSSDNSSGGSSGNASGSGSNDSSGAAGSSYVTTSNGAPSSGSSGVSTPTVVGTAAGKGIPPTGDTLNLYIVLTALLGSAAILFVTVYIHRKKHVRQ